MISFFVTRFPEMITETIVSGVVAVVVSDECMQYADIHSITAASKSNLGCRKESPGEFCVYRICPVNTKL